MFQAVRRSVLKPVTARVLFGAPRVAATALRASVSRRSTVAVAVRAMSSSAPVWKVDNPYSGDIYTTVPLITLSEANSAVDRSVVAQKSWKKSPLSERKALLTRVIAQFEANAKQIARDVTGQMGKPIGQSEGEVKTAIARMKALMELSDKALADELLDAPKNFSKRITKEPVGVVLALCPWNYPLLCAVNTVATAVLSGNSVLIKMSDRTPLCANHFSDAFKAAGAPTDLVQTLHVDHAAIAKLLANPNIATVTFTGSVPGGRAVYSTAAASRFVDVGLELGGKDPAYVAADANVAYAIENVVDGANYNAGQSCCAVERVYVHASVYDEFVAGAIKAVNAYKLGDPLAAGTGMGPLAQAGSPARIAARIAAAVKAGAVLRAGGVATHDANGKGRFLTPAVLTGVTHNMDIVAEETFGPVMPIMKVASDEEAVRLMNDSKYGLTASVWTNSLERADRLNAELDAGTVFMNRCDFLDPYLPWSGRKDSGKGIGLSHHAFAAFTRTKSYNYKHTL